MNQQQESNIGSTNEEAIQKYTKAIEINTKDYNSYFNRGVVLSAQGRKEEAIKDYTKAIEINPKYAQAYCNRGIAQNASGRKQDAIKDFTNAIEIDSKYTQAYMSRGVVQNALGRNEVAIEDFTIAIKIDPKYAQAYMGRGKALNALGRKEEAINDYTKAIEIDPNYASAYSNRGIVLSAQGRTEEAINDYTKAIEIDPQYAQAYYNRGIQLSALGRKQDAVGDYTKAIEIDPKNAYYSNRGNALSEQGRKQDAINDYTKAIEIDPQQAQDYYNRGNALNALGRKQDAIKDYTKAIEIDPKYDQAYCNRGNALNALGRNEEAYKDYLLAYKLQPQNPFYNIQLGRSLLVDGEKQKAYEFLLQGMKLTSILSQEDKKKYNLSEGNIIYIQKQTELIQQIEEEISKFHQLIKSKTLSESEQKFLQDKIKPIEAQFKQQNNQPINNDNTENNVSYQQLYKELIEFKQNFIILTEKVIQLEDKRDQIIKKEMIQLKQDNNRYIYYQSLYWRLYNYISACQQLSTDLFQKNTDAVIDNDKERVAQMISKVVQQISNQTGSIPIAGTVVTIISSALEFSFSHHLDYKFNSIVRKLTQIVQERCVSGIDKDEEIQLAVLKQSKQLGELTQDQQLKEQGLLNHVEQIQSAEKDRENQEAYNQYWKQGVVDTLRILRNLLLNYKNIQLDKKKELHIVILEQLKEDERQFNHQQVMRVRGSWCERCNNCSIQ